MPGATGASGTRRLRALGASVTRHEEGTEQEQQDREADRGGGDVERVEPQVADADIDEVDDVADSEPVGHIPERATQQQPERDRQQRVPSRGVVEPDDRPDDADRDDREEQRLVVEEPEQRAGVLRMDKAHVVADDLDLLAGRQERHEPRLGQLVEDEDRRSDPDEDRPARPSSARGRGGACGHRAQPSLRRAMLTGSASRVTAARCASAGGSPWRSSASVSSATGGRNAATASGRPTTHSSIRSSSSSSASRRSSWIARASSRASPSARRASVRAVSRTITSPSSSATAVPGRGVAWMSTSSAASVLPAMLTAPY